MPGKEGGIVQRRKGLDINREREDGSYRWRVEVWSRLQLCRSIYRYSCIL